VERLDWIFNGCFTMATPNKTWQNRGKYWMLGIGWDIYISQLTELLANLAGPFDENKLDDHAGLPRLQTTLMLRPGPKSPPPGPDMSRALLVISLHTSSMLAFPTSECCLPSTCLDTSACFNASTHYVRTPRLPARWSGASQGSIRISCACDPSSEDLGKSMDMGL
jgi:hypothetical protein